MYKMCFLWIKRSKSLIGAPLERGGWGNKAEFNHFLLFSSPSLPLLTQPVYCPKVLSLNNKWYCDGNGGNSSDGGNGDDGGDSSDGGDLKNIGENPDDAKDCKPRACRLFNEGAKYQD